MREKLFLFGPDGGALAVSVARLRILLLSDGLEIPLSGYLCSLLLKVLSLLANILSDFF